MEATKAFEVEWYNPQGELYPPDYEIIMGISKEDS